MTRSKHIVGKVALLALALAALVLGIRHPRTAGADADGTCASGGNPQTFIGAALDSATPTRAGVAYDAVQGGLSLNKQGGVFSQTALGISSSDVKYGCAADFDKDGWTDFVATGDGATSYVRFYKNRTYENPAPNWSDPNQIRTPKFVVTGADIRAADASSVTDIGCGDFNGDGNPDFFIVRCASNCDSTGQPSVADMYLGNGDGTFRARYQFLTTPSSLSLVNWWGTTAPAFYDYNKDGRLDMVWALATASGGGQVVVLLNDGASQPKFDTRVTLLTDLGLGTKVPGLGLGDVTGDGLPDLVIGSPDSSALRVYPGVSGNGFSSTYLTTGSGFGGSANSVLVADFSLDGRNDVIVASDGNFGNPGGKIYYWQSNRTANPFSGGVTASAQTTASDLDTAWVFDYDHDPDHTLDYVAADGNDSAKYYLFANRTLSTYVSCGQVSSSSLDLGSLSSTEMTVTTVRLAPTPSAPAAGDGTVAWEASNDGGRNWTPALPCVDDASQYCATFTSTVGNDIRWRATLCSSSDHTRAPTLTGVTTNFSYTLAQNHYRAGVIARDGLIYAGAFREPGDAGHMFALKDATGAVQWDGATILQAQTTRNLYTVSATNVRYAFATASASDTTFQSIVLAANATAASDLVTWATSNRFGLLTPQKLGAIETSTPALLSPPKAPYWYSNTATSSGDRSAIDSYVSAYASRPQLVFVGAKDGALHAFRTNPNNASDPNNGKEAWAFIPYDVAHRMAADKASGVAAAYPDGSPTLVSAKVNGSWRTVLVSGEGNGGHSVYALDVTQTIDPSSGAILGPTPLWQFSDANMGRTYSKPAVARIRVSGVERWLAVFASGPADSTSALDQGDSLYAVDLTTGALVWRFDLGDTGCYFATDVLADETDDETGTALDGYIDRIFVADNKGRIWKLDPASYSGTTISPVNSTVNVGLTPRALFSTRLTAGGLGQDRAIAGQMAAASDGTGRLVLYFGTGGTDDTPAGAQNAFYAVYADTGEIRSTLGPDQGIVAGLKFYGGVVYNDGQLLFSTGQDLSAVGLCAPSAGNVMAIDANTFTQQFQTATGSKMNAPMFVQNGEIYTVTLSGQLVTSTVSSSGSGGSGGGSGGSGSSGSGATGGLGQGQATQPWTIMTWRRVYQ
jgi:VCBS repeat protein